MSASAESVVRPAYRPYRARVRAVRPLSPHFVRVTFGGADLVHFAPHAKDQRIKIVFPLAADTFTRLGVDLDDSLAAGDWYSRWRELPDAERPAFRTYTARIVRPEAAEVDVDFVVHQEDGHEPGPATAWLADATVGDEVLLVGPDVRSPGSEMGMDWRPGTATRVLLVGDETAAPAICGILEALPAHVTATACIEVATSDDVLAVTTSATADVRWLPRDGAQTGVLLDAEVRAFVVAEHALIAAASVPQRQELEEIDVDAEILWDTPEAVTAGEFYAWIAGESAVVKSLRRVLVTESGVDRRRVAFMGYWRKGVAERIG